MANRTSSATRIEERFQAALKLQQLYALPIYQLPGEILVNIFDRLWLEDFPALIAAAWHLLRHSGVAPVIPTPRLREILLWPRHGFYDSYEHATDASRGVDRGYLPFQVRRTMTARLAPEPLFFHRFTNMAKRLQGGFERLPIEIRYQIIDNMDTGTMLNVSLAAYRFSDRHIEWLTHEEI
ncbi:hypothetical protein ACLMJK_002263 [Lecanora helva]